MGLGFKENCPDLRNTKVVDLLDELKPYNANIDVFDPWVNHEEAITEYGLKLITELKKDHYDAIIIAVAHKEFIAMGAEQIHMLGKNRHVLFDIKYVLDGGDVDGRL